MKYRLIASEIRNAARGVALEESRTSLINLANAYERMATAADAAAERLSVECPPPQTGTPSS
ncbi:MAG TPA: hypothetical protein VL966_06650 [Alphaproteobacteria bacterium]|jgi:hypothetical protein|nr:hypothetical protein [Alphaproteobacteria bacterium]